MHSLKVTQIENLKNFRYLKYLKYELMVAKCENWKIVGNWKIRTYLSALGNVFSNYNCC